MRRKIIELDIGDLIKFKFVDIHEFWINPVHKGEWIAARVKGIVTAGDNKKDIVYYEVKLAHNGKIVGITEYDKIKKISENEYLAIAL